MTGFIPNPFKIQLICRYVLNSAITMCQYILLISIFLLAACHRYQQVSSGSFFISPATTQIDSIKISFALSDAIYKEVRYASAVNKVYLGQRENPIWLKDNRPSERGMELIHTITSARRRGILPQDYHLSEITSLLQEKVNHAAMARLDLLCTDAFLSMAGDLKFGRTAQADMDSVTASRLVYALRTQSPAAILKQEEPKIKGYQLLKDALNHILDTLAKNERDLLMSGITVDSVPAHEIVKRIEINLERWRFENLDTLNPYVFVNIPSYRFYVIENGIEVMESKVIVGKGETPTPALTSTIDCFTIFPYWFVPRKILINEYLPVLKKDSAFLKRNNFDVLDRSGKITIVPFDEWKKYSVDNFPFTLRQREGPDNSLGIIKFTFDNPYAVYLHDTNAKYLFEYEKRSFSHGCIRLEKAIQFSHFLIGGGRSEVSNRQLNNYLKNTKRVTVNLLKGVPIYVRYYTCEVRDARLNFYDDLYGKDQKLAEKLYPRMSL
jgi:L,D-transpeptidase YcbB